MSNKNIKNILELQSNVIIYDALITPLNLFTKKNLFGKQQKPKKKRYIKITKTINSLFTKL